jgi:hypothetical protein
VGGGLWLQLKQACDFATLRDLEESADPYANFDRISLLHVTHGATAEEKAE